MILLKKILKSPFFLVPAIIIVSGVIFQDVLLQLALNSGLSRIVVEVAYPQSPNFPQPTGRPEKLTILTEQVKTHIDEKFLSFAIDTSQAVGGLWWSNRVSEEGGTEKIKTLTFNFNNERLDIFARNLAPAYLRIGGTDADKLVYAIGDMPKKNNLGTDNNNKDSLLVLSEKAWDDINRFTQRNGLSLFFTVNSGPSARNRSGDWTVDNTQRLFEYTKNKGYRVPVWELGNEINGFWYTHGKKNHINGKQYAKDFLKFKHLVATYFPQAKTAGPASTFWPLVGEPLNFKYGVFEDFMIHGGGLVDIITWHYYPQQSKRCRYSIRRAEPNLLLNPSYLDEITKWIDKVEYEKEKYASSAEIILGETGNAQCGGEPGVSDAFVGGLWWMDELGLCALRGQKAVIRQAFSGASYGLIEEPGLRPRPDYWLSVMFKRLVGTGVLGINRSMDNAYVRAYAFCTRGQCGSITLMLINVNETQPAEIRLAGLFNTDGAEIFEFTTPDLYRGETLLNGALVVMEGNSMPELRGRSFAMDNGNKIGLPAGSCTFIVFPNAGMKSCCNS